MPSTHRRPQAHLRARRSCSFAGRGKAPLPRLCAPQCTTGLASPLVSASDLISSSAFSLSSNASVPLPPVAASGAPLPARPRRSRRLRSRAAFADCCCACSPMVCSLPWCPACDAGVAVRSAKGLGHQSVGVAAADTGCGAERDTLALSGEVDQLEQMSAGKMGSLCQVRCCAAVLAASAQQCQAHGCRGGTAYSLSHMGQQGCCCITQALIVQLHLHMIKSHPFTASSRSSSPALLG